MDDKRSDSDKPGADRGNEEHDGEHDDTARCYRHPKRETLVRCNECERPICPDCAVQTPVGLKCRECAGVQVKSPGLGGSHPLVTAATLLAIIVYTGLEFALYGFSPNSGELATLGGSSRDALERGEWWALVSANFLHVNLIHVALNLFFIFMLGREAERELGHRLMLSIVLFGGLSSSLMAMLLHEGISVGASGIGFALMGAGVAHDRRRETPLGAIAWSLLPANVIITFVLPGISIGGHLGGLLIGLAIGALPRALKNSSAVRWTLVVPAALATVALLLTAPGTAGKTTFDDEGFSSGQTGVAPYSESEFEAYIRDGVEFDEGDDDDVHDADCESADDEGWRWDCVAVYDNELDTAFFTATVEGDGSWTSERYDFAALRAQDPAGFDKRKALPSVVACRRQLELDRHPNYDGTDHATVCVAFKQLGYRALARLEIGEAAAGKLFS